MLASLGMFRGGDPVFHDLLEFHGGVAGMRGHHEFEDRAFAAGGRRWRLKIAGSEIDAF